MTRVAKLPFFNYSFVSFLGLGYKVILNNITNVWNWHQVSGMSFLIKSVRALVVQPMQCFKQQSVKFLKLECFLKHAVWYSWICLYTYTSKAKVWAVIDNNNNSFFPPVLIIIQQIWRNICTFRLVSRQLGQWLFHKCPDLQHWKSSALFHAVHCLMIWSLLDQFPSSRPLYGNPVHISFLSKQNCLLFAPSINCMD